MSTSVKSHRCRTGNRAASRSGAPSPDAEREYRQAVQQLRPLARHLMRGERVHHTLQPTALINEALLSLLRGASRVAVSATRFRREAAVAMRHVLVDSARRKKRVRRGGEFQQVQLTEAERQLAGSVAVDADKVDALAVHASLEKLEQSVRAGSRERRVIELHFFEGYSFREIAAQLEISERQVGRDWRHARAWLHRELSTKI